MPDCCSISADPDNAAAAYQQHPRRLVDTPARALLGFASIVCARTAWDDGLGSELLLLGPLTESQDIERLIKRQLVARRLALDIIGQGRVCARGSVSSRHFQSGFCHAIDVHQFLGGKSMSIAVLGAGIQGVCVALELALLGFEVDLFEQEARPFRRASGYNEGKIHLGLVYAMDRSLETARLMMDGAVRFGLLLRRFVGPDVFVTAMPFDYLVASDSMVPSADVENHFENVEAIYREVLSSNPQPRLSRWLAGAPF